MNAQHPLDWLTTTVHAVRELVIERLAAAALDAEAKRQMEMVVEELDFMWQELQGEAQALLREKERYAEFFEYAPDACVITDAAGCVREANQAALELLASAPEDLIGSPIGAYVPDDEHGASATPVSWQGRLQRADGKTLDAQFSVRALPLKNSGAGGLCWLMRPAA